MSRAQLAEMLRGMGFTLEDEELQTTGVVAARVLSGKRVLALTMPGILDDLDGLQLITKMRAHPRLANVPVLIVSSHGSEEDRQRGLDAGADGYIVKTSFDEAGLLSAVSRLLGRTSSQTDQTRNGASAPATARGLRVAPAGNAGPA